VREGNAIVPIAGVEAYFRPERGSKETRKAWHLCLFAKNLTGWHSLLRITSRAYEDNEEGGGFYQYPCVDWDLLETHREGLIASTACVSGWLGHSIKLGDDKGANDYLKRMQKLFGDDLWLEIMPHDFDEQRMINIEIANLAQQHSIPIIATTDAHFPYADWADTQQVAKLMATSSSFQKREKQIADRRAKKEAAGEEDDGDEGFATLVPTAYLMSEDECRKWFADAHPNLPTDVVDEGIANTHLLAQSTTPFMLNQRNKLPKVVDSMEEAEATVREWCEEGFERIQNPPPEIVGGGNIFMMKVRDPDKPAKSNEEMKVYRERYEYEMGVLKANGVLDYIIITGETVRWARSQNILTNIRGSAAGSLVLYLIGLTPIDPITWGLLFERFLNPGRKGLPDIDIDFQHDRRGEVKAWLAERYGADHIADIISHQTFQPKAVIADVARTFDVPFVEINELNATIDIRAEDEETTLEEIRPINDKLDEFAKKYPDVWKHALRLEGMVRNASKHAAGVVITDEPVTRYMPLERGKKGDHVTSWSDRADFPAVSDYGLLKLDMLGIKGLTKQAVALDLIAKRHNRVINLMNLPIHRDPHDVDPEVMKIFQAGFTLGIWQFGSRGITNLLKSIKPDWGGDLTAANALYRPGPMGEGSTWEYADLKQMPSDEIVYWDDLVKPVLEETYGIVAYQEQVMEICKTIGGFSGGQADDMRKAMGKLYRLPGSEAKRFMNQFKNLWDSGIAEHGLDERVGESIWERILSFGGYGFNKSHAATYSVQAYEDAWLKYYFPHEFYCALLWYPPSTTQKNSAAKARFMQAVYREADHLGVKIAPPDINTSDKNFTLDGDVLRYGLQSVKDLGPAAANAIMKYRPFESWEDFTKRVPAKECNSKARTALIESGAADRFDLRADKSGAEIIALEKDRLGLAMSMTSMVEQNRALILEHVHSTQEFEDLAEDDEAVIGGDVININETTVKKGYQQGRKMAFVDLALGVEQWRCTFFADMWDAHRDLIESGEPIMVVGAKNNWRSIHTVKVQQVISLSEWLENIEAEEGAVA
jgi:DNA polymerase-3 subunit alpha